MGDLYSSPTQLEPNPTQPRDSKQYSMKIHKSGGPGVGGKVVWVFPFLEIGERWPHLLEVRMRCHHSSSLLKQTGEG